MTFQLMTMNVYNIVWADDEIDDLLDDETLDELNPKGLRLSVRLMTERSLKLS